MSRTIKAAVVPKGSKIPVYKEIEFEGPKAGEITIKVVASGFHHLVKGRALGRHYSVSDESESDRPIGVDGVGYIDGTTDLVYFASAAPAFGSCAQYVNVPKENISKFPDDYNSEEAIARVAALSNGVMSSLFALGSRVQNMKKDPIIAILGVTGTAGQLAVQVAKKLFGASRVIGIARTSGSLTALKLKQPLLDSTLLLEEPLDHIVATGQLSEVDVVLDYLYGEPATKIMTAALKSRKDPTRALNWVQIGQMAGQDTIGVPAGILRGYNFYLLGSGIGPLTGREMFDNFDISTVSLAKGELNADIKCVDIEDIAKVWDLPWSSARIYFKFSH